MNWDDLKIALAIARAGSMSRAADLLGMDQSTVGRRLAALEAALGEVLFVRAKTGMTPTEPGAAVVARATDIETRLDRMIEELSAGEDGPTGIVRILGNQWVLDHLAAHSMASFLAHHPRVDLRTVSLTPRLPFRGEATVSIWFETQPKEMEFAIQLGAVPYGVYARRDADPDKLGWVSFFDEDAPRLATVRALEKLRRKGERVRMTGTDARILLTAVRAGVGKALLPMCLARGRDDLVRLGDGPPELTRILNLHMHPDTVQTKRVQAVIRWLRESFEVDFAVRSSDAEELEIA